MLDLADEFDAERRGAFRRALILSCVAHATLLAFVYFAPSSTSRVPALPGVITVDLVAVAPGPPPVAPAPPAPKPEVPAPVPVAPAKPPPPPPPQKVLLPKEATRVPEPVPPKAKPKPPPQDYDALMKELRAQAGDARPEPVATAQPTQPVPAGVAGGTVRVSPEVAAWIRDVRIHVHKNWIKMPGFERLETTLLVNLDAAGNVVGEPKIKQRSGNPYYDDSVIRAIQKASPLPKPPAPGEWTFVFPSEEPS
ncbi:MAG TPA: energy transducer TonB [Myxococcota bacterium]|nr:energy transducer TonB [Myxococcota bacterium]